MILGLRPSARDTNVQAPRAPLPARPLVCVVEDYPEVATTLELVLRHDGLDVIRAPSGAVLDSVLDQGIAPDVFLLDLNLPGETGIEILRRLRANPVHADKTMLCMSALVSRGDRAELRQLGFDGLIPKPFETTRVAGQILAVGAGQQRS